MANSIGTGRQRPTRAWKLRRSCPPIPLYPQGLSEAMPRVCTMCARTIQQHSDKKCAPQGAVWPALLKISGKPSENRGR